MASSMSFLSDDFEQDVGSYENFDDFDDSDMQALDEAEQDSKDSMVEKKVRIYTIIILRRIAL